MSRNESKSFGDRATFLDPLLGRLDISSWLLRSVHRICKSPFLLFHIRFLPEERGLFFFKSRVICSLGSILDKAMFKLPLLDTRLPAHPSHSHLLHDAVDGLMGSMGLFKSRDKRHLWQHDGFWDKGGISCVNYLASCFCLFHYTHSSRLF